MRRTSALTALAFIFTLAMPVLAQANKDQLVTYIVTIENLAPGQPFSAPVAATHKEGLHMFQVGQPASEEIEAIAEDGKYMPMFEKLNGSDMVTQTAAVITHIVNSATLEITAHPGDRFSLATMLICTNDGFTGLDAVQLPETGSAEFMLETYDAGTENNTEQSQDIVDGCSKFGPVNLPGDPDGNEDKAVATEPANAIEVHPGIQGNADLTVDTHGWTNPVARVTITVADKQQGMSNE